MKYHPKLKNFDSEFCLKALRTLALGVFVQTLVNLYTLRPVKLVGVFRMREFKRCNLEKIAKYVMAYFKGELAIQGVGKFTFENGRVVRPQGLALFQHQIVSLINQRIKAKQLMTRRAA